MTACIITLRHHAWLKESRIIIYLWYCRYSISLMPGLKSTLNLPSSLMCQSNALLMERTGDRRQGETEMQAVLRKQSDAELNWQQRQQKKWVRANQVMVDHSHLEFLPEKWHSIKVLGVFFMDIDKMRQTIIFHIIQHTVCISSFTDRLHMAPYRRNFSKLLIWYQILS